MESPPPMIAHVLWRSSPRAVVSAMRRRSSGERVSSLSEGFEGSEEEELCDERSCECEVVLDEGEE